MDTNKIREYAETRRLLESREADVKALKQRLEALEAEIIDQYADEGVSAMKVSDGERSVNVYMQTQLFARNLKGPDATAAVLMETGYGHLVTPRANAQSLSALLRQLTEAGEVPAEFEGVIEAFEKVRLGVRAS
jgi:hypothetical protein